MDRGNFGGEVHESQPGLEEDAWMFGGLEWRSAQGAGLGVGGEVGGGEVEGVWRNVCAWCMRV